MGDINHEPTMEEILASIKKIIAEDGDAAEARPAPARKAAPEPAEEASEVDAEAEAVVEDDAAGDVLELTETIEAEAVAGTVETGNEEPIASEETVESSRAALAALAAISSSDASSDDGSNGQALENMVREMLRPMLKQWLDDNLPAIIERMVAKEIARIAGTEG